ncbi:MAG: NADH-quinone oxidoreductase subunit C [Chloroflexi bacterium]|nr:NADH-quinone oxidoreductase subunit C [Chloroflexota bacterium]
MSSLSRQSVTGEHYQGVPVASLRLDVEKRASSGQRLMMMVGRDAGDSIELLVAFDAGRQIEVLQSVVPMASPHYPALTPVLPAAAWYERELAELLGVQPEGHPDLRPLLLPPDWPRDVFPLRKSFSQRQRPAASSRPRSTVPVTGPGVFTIPYGPVRSGIFETTQFVVATAGEDVLHVDMQPGYKHRGVEKQFELLELEPAVLLAEEVSGTATIAHSMAFCQAVERALHLSIPPAARWLRVLTAELERLYNHFDVIARLCDDASQSVAQAQFAAFKEEILRNNVQISGSRFLRGVNQIGGVCRRPTPGILSRLRHDLGDLQRRSEDRIALLLRTNSFIDRLIGTSLLPNQLAAQFAAVGPVARASGLDRDCRVDRPYAAYDHCDWEVATGPAGDAMERLRVRIQEITQSFGLIAQALEALPAGPLAAPLPQSLPEGIAAFGWAESPRGEVLYWVRLGTEGRIDRCKVRSPSFVNWPLFTRAIAGNVLTDFGFAEHSFGLTQAGCDL